MMRCLKLLGTAVVLAAAIGMSLPGMSSPDASAPVRADSGWQVAVGSTLSPQDDSGWQ